jgi:hypothetical protein
MLICWAGSESSQRSCRAASIGVVPFRALILIVMSARTRGEHRHRLRSGGLRNTRPSGNTQGAVPCVHARSTARLVGRSGDAGEAVCRTRVTRLPTKRDFPNPPGPRSCLSGWPGRCSSSRSSQLCGSGPGAPINTPLPPPMSRTASSARRGRGPERMTTGVPVPIISLASRLLFLSRWSRESGLALVVARSVATKQSSLRGCRPGLDRSWMPDEDSNLD